MQRGVTGLLLGSSMANTVILAEEVIIIETARWHAVCYYRIGRLAIYNWNWEIVFRYPFTRLFLWNLFDSLMVCPNRIIIFIMLLINELMLIVLSDFTSLVMTVNWFLALNACYFTPLYKQLWCCCCNFLSLFEWVVGYKQTALWYFGVICPMRLLYCALWWSF